ncbi:uncharacterized [Tachysurus ichikawai]
MTSTPASFTYSTLTPVDYRSVQYGTVEQRSLLCSVCTGTTEEPSLCLTDAFPHQNLSRVTGQVKGDGPDIMGLRSGDLNLELFLIVLRVTGWALWVIGAEP